MKHTMYYRERGFAPCHFKRLIAEARSRGWTIELRKRLMWWFAKATRCNLDIYLSDTGKTRWAALRGLFVNCIIPWEAGQQARNNSDLDDMFAEALEMTEEAVEAQAEVDDEILREVPAPEGMKA